MMHTRPLTLRPAREDTKRASETKTFSNHPGGERGDDRERSPLRRHKSTAYNSMHVQGSYDGQDDNRVGLGLPVKVELAER